MQLSRHARKRTFLASGFLHQLLSLSVYYNLIKKCLHIAYTVVSTFKGFSEIDFLLI
jgi:hypothetical protein